MILPEISIDMAYLVAERLRRSIADKPFICSAVGGSVNVTTSVGATIIMDGQTATMDSILKRADDALYMAKEIGRDSTVFEGIGKLDPSQFLGAARTFIE